MTNHDLLPVVAIMGPTAAGKTRLAVELAQRLDAEIISVDSSLVYRGMDIGTAKPTSEERGGVPHHLIDILDPAESFSTGRFREEALRLIAEIAERGRLPLLVGGTMLYFNALFHGLAALPAADQELRRQIDEQAARDGWASVHAELARVDPAAARRIHPNDPQRIQRALEVFRLTGTSLSDFCTRQADQPLPFRVIKLVVAPSSRQLLHERIRQRFLSMLDQGFLGEVEMLYRRGDLDESFPAIRAVGYRQAWVHLRGDCDRDTMTERSIVATRQFAKRQFTWLRRDTDACRFVSEEQDLTERVHSALEALLDR